MRNDEAIPFITFTLNGERFAIRQAYIHSVIPPMTLSPLPFASDDFDGMLNFNSQIVPQINPCVLNDHGREKIHDTLVIMEYNKALVALPITQLQAESFYLPAQSENKPAEQSWKDCSTLGGSSITCIDVPALLTQLSKAGACGPSVQSVFRGENPLPVIKEMAARDYLIVEVNTLIFAVPLEAITKIIALGHLTVLPLSPPYILGTSLIDGYAVPIIDGTSKTSVKEKRDCLIFAQSDYRYGVVIDQQYGLQNFHDDDIFTDDETQQLSIMRDGLAMPIASLEQFVSDAQQVELSGFNTRNVIIKEAIMPQRSFLILPSSTAFLGIDIRHIYRILPNQYIEPLPFSHASVQGSIELEGNVIPILRTPILLAARHAEEELLILKKDNELWGLYIHRSEEIVMLDENAVSHIHQDERRHIEGYASYRGQPLVIINADWLCSVNVIAEQKAISA